VVRQLGTSVDALREKSVLRVAADSVTSVAFEEAGALLWSAQRDSADMWRLTSPAGRETKTWRFNSLLSDMDGLEATRFAADAEDAAGSGMWDESLLAAYGLDSPQWSIVVTRADGTSSTLQVGARRDGEAFVLGDEVHSISVVDDDAVEGLHLDVDDVSTAPVQEPDRADADAATAN
jgi:hypothetical protein